MTCSLVTSPGEKPTPEEFLVISVTIPDYFTALSVSPKQTQDDTVIASYASIERIRKIPSPVTTTPSEGNTTTSTAADHQKIEWLMALTSNAGGMLPQWVQNLAVPGQIAKDVPLFLGWIAKEREEESYVRG